MKKAGIFIIIFLYTFSGFSQEIKGSWFGTLEVPGGKLRLVFHINEKSGVYQTTLDSPDQGANGIPTATTTLKDSHLKISIPTLKAQYEGVCSEMEIKGTFTQVNIPFPLTLTRKEIMPERPPERPQEPRPPYPYHCEEVTFENLGAGIKLAGTLTLPQKSGTYPAVILITGSGAQDRDEKIAGHKPFLVIADHLTRQGIAVLRFDERGTGASTGVFQTSTTVDFAADVKAAINYLKTRKEIESKKIGLIGHSEGGMIAPMIAVENPDVAFMVLLAAPGIHNSELWIRQLSDIVAMQGISEDKIKPMMQCYQDILQILKTMPNATAKPELEKYLKTHLQDFTAGEQIPPEKQKPFINQLVKTLLSPWFRYFITYNPVPVLEKIKCPVLALNGDKDLQVNASQNLLGINQALSKAGNKSFETIPLRGLNHLFQECKTGAPTEYGQITQTFSPEALNIISNWILKQTRKEINQR